MFREFLADLVDHLTRIEALVIGIERVLAQAGYQTIIVLFKHTDGYLPKISVATLSRRYSPSSALKSSSEKLM